MNYFDNNGYNVRYVQPSTNWGGLTLTTHPTVPQTTYTYTVPVPTVVGQPMRNNQLHYGIPIYQDDVVELYEDFDDCTADDNAECTCGCEQEIEWDWEECVNWDQISN